MLSSRTVNSAKHPWARYSFIMRRRILYTSQYWFIRHHCHNINIDGHIMILNFFYNVKWIPLIGHSCGDTWCQVRNACNARYKPSKCEFNSLRCQNVMTTLIFHQLSTLTQQYRANFLVNKQLKLHLRALLMGAGCNCTQSCERYSAHLARVHVCLF